MAKKDFSNLKKKRTTQSLSDEKIDAVLDSMESPQKEKPHKQKNVVYTLRIPESLFDAVDTEARTTGMTKKYVIMQALQSYLQNKQESI